ncbi:hypothetical protein AgCh_038584 [Apium graveolens]
MAMCLKATNPEYLNRIYNGPHRPMKAAVLLTGELEKMIDKDRKDYSPEDISSVMKDAKVEEKPKEKARRKSYAKGKSMIARSDTESSNSNDDSNTDNESDTVSDHNNNKDMDQMVALLVKASRRWSTRTSRKGKDFPEKVPAPQTLIRGTIEEILIERNLDLENLTSQKRDVTTVMDLDTFQLTIGNPELRRNKL